MRSGWYGFAHLVSLTIYIEIEGYMIPQNDPLVESYHPDKIYNIYKFWSGMVDPIETKMSSHHTPLYLNVYGQAHQVSKSIPPPSRYLHWYY